MCSVESGDSTSLSISRAQTAQLPDQNQVREVADPDEAKCISQPAIPRPDLRAREPAPLRPDIPPDHT